MHPYSQLALDLKAAGFSQTVEYRDGVYLPQTDEYCQPGQIPDGLDAVRVPHAVALVSSLEHLNYTVECCAIERGPITMRGYRLTAPGMAPIEDGSFGVVLAKFWLLKKASGDVR